MESKYFNCSVVLAMIGEKLFAHIKFQWDYQIKTIWFVCARCSKSVLLIILIFLSNAKASFIRSWEPFVLSSSSGFHRIVSWTHPVNGLQACIQKLFEVTGVAQFNPLTSAWKSTFLYFKVKTRLNSTTLLTTRDFKYNFIHNLLNCL